MVPASTDDTSSWDRGGGVMLKQFEETRSVREEIITGVVARHTRTST